MQCPKCGSANNDTFTHCTTCGGVLYTMQTGTVAAADGSETPSSATNNRQTVPDYMVQSVLLLIASFFMACCNCLAFFGVPFSIVAIVYANKVRQSLLAHDIVAAQDASKTAKMWCWIAFGILIVSVALGVLFFGIGIASSILEELH